MNLNDYRNLIADAVNALEAASQYGQANIPEKPAWLFGYVGSSVENAAALLGRALVILDAEIAAETP